MFRNYRLLMVLLVIAIVIIVATSKAGATVLPQGNPNIVPVCVREDDGGYRIRWKPIGYPGAVDPALCKPVPTTTAPATTAPAPTTTVVPVPTTRAPIIAPPVVITRPTFDGNQQVQSWVCGSPKYPCSLPATGKQSLLLVQLGLFILAAGLLLWSLRSKDKTSTILFSAATLMALGGVILGVLS